MRVEHTALSRAAATTAAALALVQLLRILTGDQVSYVAALLLTLVFATAATVAKMCRDNCLESRVMIALLAAFSAGGGILTTTAGLPGQPANPLGPLGLLAVALSCGVLALLAVDQPRRAAGHRGGSPYAS